MGDKPVSILLTLPLRFIVFGNSIMMMSTKTDITHTPPRQKNTNVSVLNHCLDDVNKCNLNGLII